MLDLFCRAYGDPASPPIVLIHGLFGSSANWGSVARRLAGRFHVLVPDLRNHGQSPHTQAHSYPSMASDIDALLNGRGVPPVTLVGHSMGGKVAMQFALTRPSRVRGLVVVDIAPVDYRRDYNDVLDAFAAVDLDTLASRRDAEGQLANHVSGPGLRAFLLQNLVKTDGVWRWRLNLQALADAQAEITGFPAPAEGACYTGPTLFLHGERSDHVRPEHHDGIRRLFSAAGIEFIADAGHWVYADQPQAFLDRLEAFLDVVP